MRKKQLSKPERKMIAEKILDLANIAAGALVFGQTSSGQKLVFWTSVLGVLILSSLYFWVIINLRKS